MQALTHHAGGDTSGVLAPLGRALTLAEPERYVRVFASQGPPTGTLLTAVARRRTWWVYGRRLLAACTGDGATGPVAVPGERVTRLGVGLVEPLSERELDVLHLLATDLDGPNIARQLFGSVNTMRTTPRASTPSWQ